MCLCAHAQMMTLLVNDIPNEPPKKKSQVVKIGERCGTVVCPPHPIQRPGKWCSKDFRTSEAQCEALSG